MSREVLSPTAVEVIDPSSGHVLATVEDVPVSELNRRVEHAARAASEWQGLTIAQRADALSALAAGIEREQEALANLESRNVGKPIRESRAEVALAARTFRYYAGALDKHYGHTIPSNPGSFHYTIRQPFGVVAAIVPWNFPLVLAAYKAAPALAAGNAVLIKPAGLTPLSAMRLAELAADCGFPEGCLQVLVGAGASLGRAIVEHPGIPKISFTGSTSVGQEIFVRAAPGLKRLTLELGGKSANVIFADAVLDRAMNGVIDAAFANAGQDCCARSRVLVARSIYGEALDRLEQRIRSISLGDPLDAATDMGPLISAPQRERVLGYVEGAVADGARVVCGGEVPFDDGFFVAPTLLRDVTPGMAVMREEIFGPVIAVYPFDDESEAIAVANATDYGLSASVWTQSAGRATRLAHAIEAGVVSINSNNSVHVTAPFGGVRASGLGRELGMAALDAYTESKSVYQAIDL